MAQNFENMGGYGEGDLGNFDPIAASLLDSGNHTGYYLYMQGRFDSELKARLSDALSDAVSDVHPTSRLHELNEAFITNSTDSPLPGSA